MTDIEPTSKSAGKGKATPSRKTQESANFKPIVGDKSPEAKKAAKEKATAERKRARDGIAAGDDRYLLVRDRGPQKKMARDIVDARLTIGELMIPVMVLVLFLSGINSPALQLGLVLTMWLVLAGIVVDGIFINRKVKATIAEKFGESKLESGLGWYAIVRATQLRIMRTPKPTVGRGSKKK
jgi:hypothetical protein